MGNRYIHGQNGSRPSSNRWKFRKGEEAYGFLQKEKIDVLVTDLTMPVMDGIELIRKIREENRDIYIIVLSCHDDFEYVKEAMRLGADEYVLKNSLDEDSLYDTLEKSARLIEKRREKSQEQARTRKLIHQIGRAHV